MASGQTSEAAVVVAASTGGDHLAVAARQVAPASAGDLPIALGRPRTVVEAPALASEEAEEEGEASAADLAVRDPWVDGAALRRSLCVEEEET